MIEKIYIPTYGRIDKQKTFDNLPENWKERAVLVAAASEEAELKKNYPVIVAPCQGPAPEGADPLEYGLSPTRKWIAYEAGDIKHAVFDDDMEDFLYTLRPSDKKEGEPPNIKINKDQDKFDEMMADMDRVLDEVVTAGLEVTWNPPMENDVNFCWRQTTNHFYNGKTFPKDKIDFTSLKCTQDYFILLQLLTMGYQNAVHMRWRVRPSGTQAKGGCAVYRTIEVHNKSMRDLQERFPKFVSLRETTQNSGSWKGMTKLAAMIQWKKAYKSSQAPEEVKPVDNSLEGFFG